MITVTVMIKKTSLELISSFQWQQDSTEGDVRLTCTKRV